MRYSIDDYLDRDYTHAQNDVWRALMIRNEVLSPFQIAAETNLSPAAILTTLRELEQERLVEERENGAWHYRPGIPT